MYIVGIVSDDIQELTMKKVVLTILLVFLYALALLSVYSQEEGTKSSREIIDDIVKQTNNFKGLARALGVAQAHSNLTALNTSTAYLGAFPSFSVLSGFGYAFNTDLFTSLDDLAELGDATTALTSGKLVNPNLALGLSPTSLGLRFGGTKIPFDVAMYGFFIPFDISLTLQGIRGGLWTQQFGFDFRYAFVEEDESLPNISVGFTYLYGRQELYVSSNEFPAGFNLGSDANVDGDLRFALGGDTHTIALKSQISKNLRFFEPYFGIEPYIVVSNYYADFRGKVNFIEDGKAKSLVDLFKGGTNFGALRAKTNENRLTLTSENQTDAGFRVFGGYSLRIYWVYFDASISYDVVSSTVALSTGIRLQYLPSRIKNNRSAPAETSNEADNE